VQEGLIDRSVRKVIIRLLKKRPDANKHLRLIVNNYYDRIKPFWGQEIAAATQSAPWVRPGLIMATFQVLGLLLLTCVDVFAHAMTQGDKGYIQ
jgi:hypothetical protein